MNLQINTQTLRRLALVSLGSTGLASIGSAQVTFSVDWHSPTVSVPDSCTAVPMTEGDILTPALGAPALGPLAPPCIAIPGGAGGLGLVGFGPCIGHPAGTPCRVEVDALSYGADYLMGSWSSIPGDYLFSTDEFAVGGVGPVLFPSLTTEFPVGDSSADIWANATPFPPGPLAPFAAPVGNIGVIDGDGVVSGSGASYPGLGLKEPNFPGPPPNLGDNVDAFDYNMTGSTAGFPATGVYFSLDEAFFDVFSGVPNSGTAAGNGVSGADVLVTLAPGGPAAVYAPAFSLGLDMIGIPDDLDALALHENGTPGFQPSVHPYDWLAVGGPDMLLFSVRRGSAVIGFPDSIFGIPICEGDILTTPLPTAFGGVSPFPGIFCAAENLGLSTLRMPGGSMDDLNALDTIAQTFIDCNSNGVSDLLDILGGTSSDVNFNGIPDECELIGGPGCLCTAVLAPCGNADPTAGCANSTGSGGVLSASGSGSVFIDDLVLSASSMPGAVPAIFFGGTAFVGPLPFGDGLRCVGGGITRFTTPAFTTAAGTLSAGPGLAGAFGLLPAEVWTFQCWFRDPAGPCGGGFNTTNSYTVTFTP